MGPKLVQTLKNRAGVVLFILQFGVSNRCDLMVELNPRRFGLPQKCENRTTALPLTVTYAFLSGNHTLEKSCGICKARADLSQKGW